MKMFPIMLAEPLPRPPSVPQNVLRSIPWGMIAPHEAQAEKNHRQSLATLAGRGGLSGCEALAVLEDRPWRKMDNAVAHERIAALEKAWLDGRL